MALRGVAVTLLIGQEKSEMAGCLDGVRVIDLGRYQAGPRCSMILGDLGADVIKVEAAPDGDESRRLGMVYWSQYNRGKKSITLNLRSARAARPSSRSWCRSPTCCCRTSAP